MYLKVDSPNPKPGTSADFNNERAQLTLKARGTGAGKCQIGSEDFISLDITSMGDII
jgi:hypothetical protein